MSAGTKNRNGASGLGGSVVPFREAPKKGDPISLGDVLAGVVLPDLAVRMRGQFFLPKVVVRSARSREDDVS